MQVVHADPPLSSVICFLVLVQDLLCPCRCEDKGLRHSSLLLWGDRGKSKLLVYSTRLLRYYLWGLLLRNLIHEKAVLRRDCKVVSLIHVCIFN